MNAQTITIAALNGSLRPGSHTRQALQIALEGAAELGAATHLLDLLEFDLPFSAGMLDDQAAPAGVRRLRQAIRSADGLLLGTPEYHGSFSGVLKNALDLMRFDEFEGKVVGLIGVSAGALGAVNALTSLQIVGRALHAWIVPEQAAIAQVWQAFDAAGRPREAALEQRLKNVGRQVARFAFLHHSAQTQEFLRAWESAPANPGGVLQAGLE